MKTSIVCVGSRDQSIRREIRACCRCSVRRADWLLDNSLKYCGMLLRRTRCDNFYRYLILFLLKFFLLKLFLQFFLKGLVFAEDDFENFFIIDHHVDPHVCLARVCFIALRDPVKNLRFPWMIE